MLQKVYLCSNTNNQRKRKRHQRRVVNCFKKCIFAVIQTTTSLTVMIPFGCELLQKVYLCSNTNNLFQVRHVQLVVVNCFKKCIFAVIQTTRSLQGVNGKGCELLQKVYLCSNTNNSYIIPSGVNSVVNCFKKCIFAVIQTTWGRRIILRFWVVNCFKKCIFAVIQTTTAWCNWSDRWLWIASKSVSLQ